MANLIRIESDSLGNIEVPSTALWGAQTQRSIENFSIGTDKMPRKLIYALAEIKQAAATVNNHLGMLDNKKCELIVKAASEIAAGQHDSHFPLKVWQTGSGTQTNMNVNEVISNLAALASGEPLGSKSPVHPNDHANMSQSTNDTFPAAIHIAAGKELTQRLLPELELLATAFEQKSFEWREIVKIGRTHLQDAVPLTLGQEASAWQIQVSTAKTRIEAAMKEIFPLPLGGTAIGTGLNAPKNFGDEIAKELAILTLLPFTSAANKFSIMASHDGLVNLMTQIKMLAVTLYKIFNDLRLLSCGPRAGISEIELPENEPGSSIMPGKINPTQCEAMTMVCTQVIGLDTAMAMAGSGGHLQMNVYKPLIGFNLLHSIDLLSDACCSSRKNMIEGLKANHSKIKKDLDQSLMLITALTPKIGYEKASEIAQYAHKNMLNLREAAIQLGYVTADDFDIIVDPATMINLDL